MNFTSDQEYFLLNVMEQLRSGNSLSWLFKFVMSAINWRSHSDEGPYYALKRTYEENDICSDEVVEAFSILNSVSLGLDPNKMDIEMDISLTSRINRLWVL